MYRLFLMLSCVCFFGCGVRAPEAQYSSSAVTESTLEAVAMDVAFEISNTNDEPLQLVTYNYSVTANGRTIFLGSVAAKQTIPRWSTVQTKVPVVIRRDKILNSDQVTWQLSGSLGFIPPTALSETLLKSGFWKPTIPIRAHGSVSMPAHPE